MQIALYALWFLLPLIFFILALWAWLEQASGKTKKANPGDLFRQGFFVLVCVGISVALDQFVLEWLAKDLLGEAIPVGFFQIILLPVVLTIAAMALGPSKEILISKAPHPSERKKAQRPRR